MVHIRASSLADLFDCPARWEARYIKGIHLPTSSAATLGTAIHAGTAVFDQNILDNTPISVDDATEVTIENLYHPEDDVDWGEDSPEKLENTAITLLNTYCTHISPTQNYVAIEATCKNLELTDLGISLTGTTDRISKDSGYGIVDIKTGRAVVDRYGRVKTQSHAAQIGIYELLAEYSFGFKIDSPAKIIGLSTSGNKTGIGTLTGARKLLVGDGTTPGLLEYAAKYLKNGLFHGNPRSMLCTKKYCPIFNQCKWRL